MRESPSSAEFSLAELAEEGRGRAQLQQLTEIASLLTSTFDVQQILSTLMGCALTAADAEVGALWLVEKTLGPAVTWGLEEDVVRQILLSSSENAPDFRIKTSAPSSSTPKRTISATLMAHIAESAPPERLNTKPFVRDFRR